jgi:5-methyltetrahydropteroyltriglutamate--homocysteine methyltransferase
VAGPIARRHAVQVRDVEFLRANTSRQIKVTVPGPFTMSQQAQDDFYGSPDAVAAAYARAVREEVVDLFAACADIVQLDEPYMQARPDAAREYGLDAVNAAVDGVEGTIAVHLCFGYAALIHERPSGYSFLGELGGTRFDQVSIETAQSGLDLKVLESLADKTIILGVIDLSTEEVESPATVADRIRRAFPYTPPRRLVAAPDCGMKYLPRDSAYGKLEALVEGARLATADGGA